MNCLIKRLILLLSLSTMSFGLTVSDSKIGYSVDLPQNWVRDIDTVNQHSFFDTSEAYGSFISIEMTDFSSDTTYKTPLQWTKAHFLAYLLTIRSTVSSLGVPLSDPYGSIVFYDSSTSSQSGLKSMELYAQFNSLLSSSGGWDEYVKYTAVNKKGYEIYVIGDTADMKKNIDFYIDFLNSIKIDTAPSSVIFYPAQKAINRSAVNLYQSEMVFDIMGRSVVENYAKNSSVLSNNILIVRKSKYLNLVR
ncbi:MAG TPA: hypothetical protein VHO70_23775 [Chitinispirillaceae bacterium]|nr:hypothetical protein [Chitinispirillaceae bacterium]